MRKKTPLTRSLLAACSILALSAVMYGCVHSDGDDDPVPATEAEPMEPEEEEEEEEEPEPEPTAYQAGLAAIQGATTREAALAAYDAVDRTMVTAAERDALRDALNAALAVFDAADEEAAAAEQARLAELNQVMAYVLAAAETVASLNGGSWNVDIDAAKAAIAAAQSALDAAELISDEDRAAQQAAIDAIDISGAEMMISDARTAEAATVSGALMTEAAQLVTGGTAGTDGEGGADAGLGGSARSDTNSSDDRDTDTVYSDDQYGFKISRDRSGTTVEITVLGGPDTRDDRMFNWVPSGFGEGVTYHWLPDTDEVAMVMTDIEAPTPTAFATEYPLTVYDPNEDVDGPDPDTTANNDFTAIPVAEVALAAENKSSLANIMSSAFAAAPDPEGVLLTFLADVAATTDENEADEVRGSYDGAMGTYRCNGDTNCTVNLDPMGEITAISAGWVFIPDAGAIVHVEDTEYLSYGFWADAAVLDDGSLAFTEIETFAMAHGMIESEDGSGSTQIGSVTGTATYTGGSLGMYVHNVLDEEGDIVSAASGHFEADVELNASFGGGGVAANNQFTIGGTIDNFRLFHGEENDWVVTLGLADFSGRDEGATPPQIIGESGGPGTTHINTFSGSTMGDMEAAAGSWNGTFWGAAGSEIDHDGDTTTAAINQAPSAVTGEFDANFTDGMVAGGFGATISDDD